MVGVRQTPFTICRPAGQVQFPLEQKDPPLHCCPSPQIPPGGDSTKVLSLAAKSNLTVYTDRSARDHASGTDAAPTLATSTTHALGVDAAQGSRSDLVQTLSFEFDLIITTSGRADTLIVDNVADWTLLRTFRTRVDLSQ